MCVCVLCRIPGKHRATSSLQQAPLSASTRATLIPCEACHATANQKNSTADPAVSSGNIAVYAGGAGRVINAHARRFPVWPAAMALPRACFSVPNTISFSDPPGIQMRHLSRHFPVYKGKPGAIRLAQVAKHAAAAKAGSKSCLVACHAHLPQRYNMRQAFSPVRMSRQRPGRELLSARVSTPPCR